MEISGCKFYPVVYEDQYWDCAGEAGDVNCYFNMRCVSLFVYWGGGGGY